MSNELDFDKLCKLYKSDPQKFEEYRQKEIEKVISSAPKSTQKRLRGLQFQVDAKRQIHKDAPFVACIEISKMMHESFNDLRHNLNLVAGKDTPVYYRRDNKFNTASGADNTAKVISLFR